MNEKPSPAFQFYPSDFLGDPAVMAMTLEERGAYITLLCVAWMNHGIPADDEKLRKLLRLSARRFEGLWETISLCFRSDGNGRLISPRMEEVRAAQADYREAQATAGRLGAKARWG